MTYKVKKTYTEHDHEFVHALLINQLCVAEGGETIFDIGEEVAIKPEAGSVVCFPPTWQYPHKGATPISGPKYVISSYVWLPEDLPFCD